MRARSPGPEGEARRQTKEAAEDGPLDRDEAWDRALAKMAGWKAPGPDGIEAYRWKTFRGLGRELKKMLWAMNDGEMEIPQWLVTGRTVMVPKGECKGEPHQFRLAKSVAKSIHGVLRTSVSAGR